MSEKEEYAKEKATLSLHWDYKCDTCNISIDRLVNKFNIISEGNFVGDSLYVNIIDFIIECKSNLLTSIPKFDTLTSVCVLGKKISNFIYPLMRARNLSINIESFFDQEKIKIYYNYLIKFCESLDKENSSILKDIYKRNWAVSASKDVYVKKICKQLGYNIQHALADYYAVIEDMSVLMRLLNDEYKWYRDTIWKTKQQDVLKLLSREHMDVCIRYEIDKVRQRLERSLFYRLHKKYSDMYLKNCDYRRLFEDILKVVYSPKDDSEFGFLDRFYSINNDLQDDEREWTMNDLFDYFDIVLTWEFWENKLDGRSVESHDLFEIEEVEEKRVEMQGHGHEVEFGLLVEIVNRLEEVLMDGYEKEDLKRMLEDLLMSGGKEASRCWEFLMHNARIKLSTMSVGCIWMMIGYMVKCGLIKNVDQKVYMACVEGTEFGEKMKSSSVKSHLSNGKNLDKNSDEDAKVFAKCVEGWVKKNKKKKGK